MKLTTHPMRALLITSAVFLGSTMVTLESKSQHEPPTTKSASAIQSYSIDAGAGYSSGGNLELVGSAGQAVLGASSGSGELEVEGGFWANGVVDPQIIFCDGFESGDASAWSSP